MRGSGEMLVLENMVRSGPGNEIKSISGGGNPGNDIHERVRKGCEIRPGADMVSGVPGNPAD